MGEGKGGLGLGSASIGGVDLIRYRSMVGAGASHMLAESRVGLPPIHH